MVVALFPLDVLLPIELAPAVVIRDKVTSGIDGQGQKTCNENRRTLKI